MSLKLYQKLRLMIIYLKASKLKNYYLILNKNLTQICKLMKITILMTLKKTTILLKMKKIKIMLKLKKIKILIISNKTIILIILINKSNLNILPI
jgi:hypothetical protein